MDGWVSQGRAARKVYGELGFTDHEKGEINLHFFAGAMKMKKGIKAGNIILGLLFLMLTNIPLQAAEKLVLSAPEGSVVTLISEKVVTEAYGRIGIEAVVVQYPAARSLRYSSRGEVDGELYRIAGMSAKYPDLIIVPVPVNRLDGMVFTRHAEFTVKGWDSLKPYKVGVRRGIRFSDIGTKGMDPHIVNSNESLFGLLDVGRVDIIVITRVTGLEMQRRLTLHDVRALEPPVESYFLYHYLHKRNRHLVPVITSALREMDKEGLIKRIRERFIAERFGSNE